MSDETDQAFVLPSAAELVAYDRLLPGAAGRLRELARQDADSRAASERAQATFRSRTRWFTAITLLVALSALVYARLR